MIIRGDLPHPLRSRTPARPDSTDCQQRGQTVSALTGPSSSSRRRHPLTDPDPGKHFTQRGEYPARPRDRMQNADSLDRELCVYPDW